jgi:hypothetical protein
MTAAIQLSDEELANMIRSLEAAVALVRSAAGLPDRTKQERLARREHKTCRTACNGMKNEARRLEDVTQRSVFQRKQSEYEERLKAYDKELRALTAPPKKQRLTDRDKAGTAIMGEHQDGAFGSEMEVLQAANRAQDDNLRILGNTEAVMHTVEATGAEVAEGLQKQTEQLHQIDKEMSTLQAEINRAKGDLMWFARQMAGDKCFLMIMAMVVLALVFLTFWKIYSSRRGNDNAPPPPAPPPTPSPTTVALAALDVVKRRYAHRA